MKSRKLFLQVFVFVVFRVSWTMNKISLITQKFYTLMLSEIENSNKYQFKIILYYKLLLFNELLIKNMNINQLTSKQ